MNESAPKSSGLPQETGPVPKPIEIVKPQVHPALAERVTLGERLPWKGLWFQVTDMAGTGLILSMTGEATRKGGRVAS